MKKTSFIFATFFLTLSLYAQTFTALNSGTGHQLNGIDFLTENQGIVVGNGGTIFVTYSGSNWTIRNSGVISNLTDVKYINPTTIIAVGWGGTIVKSTDSGLNWSTINAGGAYHLMSLYVNGTDIFATGHGGIILKSSDEGNSWVGVGPGTGSHIFNMFFTSPMIGFAVGNDAYIHKTTNGGNSWTTSYSHNTGISEDFQLRSICFTDANNGYIVGKNLWTSHSIFLRTTDGGINWSQQIVYNTAYVDIKFLNADVGYILSKNEGSNTGIIFKTNNGGANWSLLTSIPKSLFDITFPSTRVAYTCGWNGILYRSTNINLGIEDLENDQALSLYPNPFNDEIHILLDPSIESENCTVTLYSLSGEKLISQTNTESINLSGIPSGTYLLKIQGQKIQWTKKIIKE